MPADPPRPADVWGIVLAAGTSERFGAAGKQFATLVGERLVDRVVRVAGTVCAELVVVLPPDALDRAPAGVQVVPGGASRAASVRAGFDAVPDEAEIVVIADAAHPLADSRQYREAVAAVRDGADAASPVIPVAEAIKTVQDGRIVGSVPKHNRVLLQMPLAVTAGMLARVVARGGEVTEETEAIVDLGGTVVPVPGSPANLHVTTPEDLAAAEALVQGGLDT